MRYSAASELTQSQLSLFFFISLLVCLICTLYKYLYKDNKEYIEFIEINPCYYVEDNNLLYEEVKLNNEREELFYF